VPLAPARLFSRTANREKDVLEVGRFGRGLEDRDGVCRGHGADLLAGGAGDLHPVRGDDSRAGALGGQQAGQLGCSRSPDTHDVAGSGAEIGEGGLSDEPPPVQDDDAVDGLGDLGQDVARDQDGAPLVGQAAQQGAEPVDAFRVEAVGGLVEDEDLRVAHQRGGQGQPLAHAEGELADPAIGGPAQVDDVEHLTDPVRLRISHQRCDAEVVAGAATRIGERGLQGRTNDMQRIS
jgi:hypothetical protein